MKVLIFFLAVLQWKGALVASTCWDEATVEPAMFLMSPGGYDPESLTMELCKEYCSNFEYKQAGATAGKFCLCSNEDPKTGASGSECDVDCTGEAGTNCGGSSDYDADTAAGGGSTITGFDPIATETGVSTSVTYGSVTSSNVAATYVLSPNDGSPLVDLTNNQVVEFIIPGNHLVTAFAGVDTNKPFGAAKDLNVTIQQAPAEPQIGCPTVVEPDVPYYCNFSLVTGTDITSTINYKLKDGNAATGFPKTIQLPNPFVVSIGTPPPRGTVSAFETLDIKSDTLTTVEIELGEAFTSTMYVIALEYHIGSPAPSSFTITIKKPTCAADEYCSTDGGYCSAAGTCSEVYANEYECPSADHFCGIEKTCQATTCKTYSAAPTYEDLKVITISGPSVGFGVHKESPALEVPKGSKIVTTGSPLTYRESLSGEKSDKTDGTDSGNRYYLRAIAIDPSYIYVPFTCQDEEEITASIEVESGNGPATLAATDNPDGATFCQFPIEGLDATVNKIFIPTNEEVTFTVTITKGSGVELAFDYGDTGTNVTVAAPVSFPHEQKYTFTTAGNYTVNVYATNKWSTEINYGYNSTELEVAVLNKVTTDWEVVYDGGTHQFLLDTAAGKEEVTINLQCTACGSDASKYPSLASAFIDWGDGSDEIFPLPNIYGAPIPVTHSYTSQGKYNINVTIWNLVNLEVFEPTNSPLELYEKVLNLGADLGYSQMGTFKEAMGKDKDQLPLDFNVTFIPKMDAGSVKEYIIIIRENSTEIARLAVADPFQPTGDGIEMIHHFPQEGLFNVTLTAKSPVPSAADVSVDITFLVVGDVKGIEIDDGGSTSKPNEVKTFDITFVTIGSGTCCEVDFGNGGENKRSYGVEETCKKNEYKYDPTHKELFSPFPIQTIYPEEKTYNITIYCFNNRPSEAFAELMFPVSDLDCNRPKVKIVDEVLLPQFIVTELYKSEQHVLATEATIDCNALQSTKKRWELITVVNETTLALGEAMPVMEKVPTWDKSQIVIPERFLNYGIYLVQYSLTMWGDALPLEITFQSIAKTYIKIIPTPLVAILVDGNAADITRGKDQKLALEPFKFSYDPDDGPDADKSMIKYKWWCWREGEVLPDPAPVINLPTSPDYDRATDNGGCFGTGPGLLNYTRGLWELDAGIMFKASDADKPKYHIKLEISKDTRTATAEIVLTVVGSSVPEIGVSCLDPQLCRAPVTEGMYFNSDQRLALKAACLTGGCNDKTTKFNWKLQDCTDGTVKDIPNIDSYVTKTGQNQDFSDQFAISVDLFTNNTQIICYQVTTTAQTSGPLKGEVKIRLMVNQPPVAGTCTLRDSAGDETTTGTAAKTLFQVECTGWTDPENKGIKFYKAYYNVKSPDVATPMRQDIFSNPAVPVGNLALPPGKYVIYIEVEDIWGGISKPFSLPEVDISEPTVDELKEQLNEKNLGSIAGSGDVTQLSALAQSTFVVLNTVDNFKLEGKDPQKQEKIQLQSAQIKKTLLKEMNEQMSMESEAQRQMALSVLTAAVAGVTSDGPAGKTMASIGRQNAVELLDNIVAGFINSGPSSPQKMQETFRSVAAVSAGLINNIVSVGKDKNCSDAAPPADIANAEELDYMPGTYDKPEPAPADPLQAIQCYSKESTISDGKEQISSMLNNFDKIAKRAIQTAVLGESVSISTPNGANQKVIKDKISNIKTVDLGDKGAAINFPQNWMKKNLNTEPVAVSAGNLPVVPQVYASNADLIARESQSLMCKIYSAREDTKQIEVNDLSEDDPFIFHIPINPMTLPDPELIDCYSRIDPAFFTCYSEIDVDKTEAVLLIRFKKQEADAKFVILVDYDHMPVPVKDEEGMSYDKAYQIFDHTDTTYMEENLITYNDSSEIYTIMLRTNNTGRYFMGVLEVYDNCTDWEECIRDKTDVTFTEVVKPNMTSEYSTVMFSTGCYYFDEVFNRFATDGIKLQSAAPDMIVCESTHLTTFGSGFFVMPNTIDFNYVFANAGFTDNLTIYLTIIFTLTVYIILLVWACFADRKDIEKLGASPMPDNRKEDKYLYEVMVFTGHKTDASTDSNVSFMVSGDKGDTRVRHFGDPERPIFRKGECDVFVLATPGPLGNLNYMRIWHDNTGQGGFASWFVSFIVFKDVQTGYKYEFIANCWLAVDEDDGQIDRMIPVAGLLQKSDFNHLFTTTSQKNLSDGHLWFSVFLRPPRSRFTRCQRVSCCMALLYLSMLVNAMWYERTPDKPSGGINFGPFALSVEQIGIGVMSNLIVFPPSFLIVWLFRTSRPRKLRESRIDKALEKQGRGKQASKEWAKSDDADPKGGSQVELVKAENPEGDNNAENDKKKKKKKKFTLPWFFIILAWFLCVVCLLVSVFFLWAYGITFGNEKTTQWVTSLIVSFFSSVLFVQPLKVFLLAMLFSLICKAIDQDSDDADEDEVDPSLAGDEEWMHAQSMHRQKMSAFCPLTEAAKREAKEKRLKEKAMMSVLMELGFYFTYLTILLVISYGNRDPNAYLLKNTLQDAFIKLGDRNYDYSKVNNAGKWWNWVLEVIPTETRPQRYYNNENAYGLKMFLNDYYNRLMGAGIIRQARVKAHSCKVVKEARGMTTDCAGSPNLFDEDHEDYCRAWAKPANGKDCPKQNDPEYKYTTAKELQAYPEMKILDSYGGGGYVIRMKGSMATIKERMEELMHQGWVDELTRALFVEFYVYNAQVNLFGLASITAEFVPGGGIHPSWRFDAIRLLEYHQGFGLFVIICQVCFILYTVFFTYRAIKEIRKQRKAWFKAYWNWAELFIIINSYAAMVTYIVRTITANKITKTFKDTMGNGYIRLQHVYHIDAVFGYMISFVVFVSSLKLIKLLRFNKRMGILSATLRHCWDDLTGFLFVFFLTFLAFVQMFYLFLFKNMYDFHNFLTALESCFSMMLGKFSFEEMKNTSMFAAAMFFVFAVVMSVIMINLFITIILRSFEQIKHDLMSQPSEYQIVSFMVQRIKAFMGMGGMGRSQITPASSAGARRDVKAQEMDAKVDKMLAYINGIYFDNQMDPNSKETMKSMYLSGKKGQ